MSDEDQGPGADMPTTALPSNAAPASRAPRGLVAAALLLAVLAAAMFAFEAYDRQRLKREAKATVVAAAGAAEKQLAQEHANAVAAASALQSQLSSVALVPGSIEAALAQVSAAYPNVIAIGVAMQPGVVPGVPAYARMIRRSGNAVALAEVSPDYPKATWFLEPLRNGAGWSEPFYRPALQAYVIEYAIPLLRAETNGARQTIGVVFATIPVEQLQESVRALKIGASGYGFILSQSGHYLAHVLPELYTSPRTAADQAGASGRLALAAALRRVMSGDRSLIELRETKSGRESWLLGTPIGSTGWILVLDLDVNELVSDVRFRYRLLLIGLTLLVLLGTVTAALLLGVWRPGSPNWWRFVAAVTVIVGTGIVMVLALHLRRVNSDAHGKVQILDDASLQRFEDRSTRRVATVNQQQLLKIPTGLYIQSLEFNSANNVTIGGYVWQRYDVSLPKDLPRGVIFPDATSTSLAEAYRRTTPGAEVVGYTFKVTLRQPFDYKRYPFDRQDIWVRLWPKSFTLPVLLTPDLAAYGESDPESLPGLDDSLVLSGWSAKKSFFDYQQNDYDSTFGIAAAGAPGSTPELSFNILLQRSWASPFLANLFPLAMIAWMLFANMMNVTSKEKPWGVFAAIASLFFAIALAHSKTRDTFSAPEILYLEYYYLVMYLMVSIVMVNSFLLTRNTTLKLITLAEDEIPRLLYWPILMLLLFGVTVVVFF